MDSQDREREAFDIALKKHSADAVHCDGYSFYAGWKAALIYTRIQAEPVESSFAAAETGWLKYAGPMMSGDKPSFNAGYTAGRASHTPAPQPAREI